MLTTIDNPYNPYRDYYKWFMWDCNHMYFTSQYMARVSQALDVSYDTNALDDDAIDSVINTIINNDVLGIYAIISENDQTPLNKYYFDEINNENKLINKEFDD